jgi:hypothetical protein
LCEGLDHARKIAALGRGAGVPTDPANEGRNRVPAARSRALHASPRVRSVFCAGRSSESGPLSSSAERRRRKRVAHCAPVPLPHRASPERAAFASSLGRRMAPGRRSQRAASQTSSIHVCMCRLRHPRAGPRHRAPLGLDKLAVPPPRAPLAAPTKARPPPPCAPLASLDTRYHACYKPKALRHRFESRKMFRSHRSAGL